MKPSLLLSSVIFPACVSAQFFSEGWKPGQAAQSGSFGSGFDPSAKPTAVVHGYKPGETQPPAAAAPPKPFSLSSLFDPTSYFESGPLRVLLESAGVNVTEKLETAKAIATKPLWDERIPLITDHNFEDLVVNEELSWQDESERIWFIMITISSAQREGISRFVDDQFDLAYNLTQEAGDLKHVKWGRIDYMNVTAVTTKWGVWRAPFLVIAQDRGQTLRFLRPGQVRINPESLRELLSSETWKIIPPWTSAFAPGGPRAFVLEYLAVALTKIYDIMVMVPRWALLVISGTLASVLVNLLHRISPGKKSATVQKKEVEAAAPKTTTSKGSSTATSASGTKAKQRKGR